MSLRVPSIAIIVLATLSIACGALGGNAAPVFVGIAGLATGVTGLFAERMPGSLREKSVWLAGTLLGAVMTLTGLAALHPFTFLLGLNILAPSLIGLLLMPVGGAEVKWPGWVVHTGGLALGAVWVISRISWDAGLVALGMLCIAQSALFLIVANRARQA